MIKLLTVALKLYFVQKRTPEFVDIDINTFNLDLELESTLKNKNIKHCYRYAGNPCEWKELRYLADSINIFC